MGWFFTQAALLTFGGAYAVLPFVIETAVETYGWATAPQMIDGLALGETTPGPLIMFVAFVGFVGGWTRPVFADAFASGAFCASVATFFTFLPSFLFILAGGRSSSARATTRSSWRRSPAITAAVVGVIANLMVFFALHVFWPHAADGERFAGGFDAVSFAIAVACAAALVSKKLDVIPVIAASGAVGLALWAAGLQPAL
jgi:chromate transporter